MLRASLLSLLFVSCFITTAQADITFSFTYQDVINGSGFGFDDATDGATRQATANAVGAYLNSVIDTPNGDVTVDLHFDPSDNDSMSTTLASFGTLYFLDQGVYEGILAEHIQSGSDPDGGGDGSGQVNFGRNWNSDLGAPAVGEFDLFSVLLHEFTHALGFASLIESDGTPSITGTYGLYDTFLVDAMGNRLVSDAGVFDAAQLADLTGGDSGAVFFDVNKDGTELLDIYVPNPFEDGSSISHLSFTEDAVMNPAISSGVMERTFSSADRAVLTALGYQLTPVPEPSTILLLLTTAGCGLVYRRRKNSQQSTLSA